jgi:hypothetical protein
MRLNLENYTEEFIKHAIAQGEAYDDKDSLSNKLNNKLAGQSVKFYYFLAKHPIEAKKLLDDLIKNENFYVMKNTALILWEFNYRMDDCYRLFEKMIKNTEEKHGLTVITADSFYLAIKEGRIERRKEFQNLIK